MCHMWVSAGVHQVETYDRVRGISYWTKNYWTPIETNEGDPMRDKYAYFDPVAELPPEGQTYWKQRQQNRFSDGKESTARISLEDGHACITPETVTDLVDLALRDRPLKSAISSFQSIQWVVPDRSGKRGCNSRDELQLFWTEVVTRLSRPGNPPALRFDINLF